MSSPDPFRECHLSAVSGADRWLFYLLTSPPASQNPEMPTAFTIWRSLWIVVLYYLGVLPFISIPEKFFFCFLPTIINRYQ